MLPHLLKQTVSQVTPKHQKKKSLSTIHQVRSSIGSPYANPQISLCDIAQCQGSLFPHIQKGQQRRMFKR